MLVFVFHAEHTPLLQQTVKSVQAVDADWCVIPVTRHAAAVMNERLASYGETYFLTLHAGDRLSSSFRAEVSGKLQPLSEDVAVVFFSPPGGESAAEPGDFWQNCAALWRTRAVLEAGGFPGPEELPIEEYLLLGMAEKLKVSGSCVFVESFSWEPTLWPGSAWRKGEMEWSLLRPFLQAGGSAPYRLDSPRVSVVICSYNDASYLPFAIRSVFSQTMADWELIVIDDGSRDETRAILKRFERESRVHCVFNPENAGKGYSLNRALDVACGEWLLELDADDWLAPDCLAALLETAGTLDPSVAVVYADHFEWIESKREQLVYHRMIQAPSSLSPQVLLSTGIPVAPRMCRASILKGEGGWLTSDPFEGRLYEDIQMVVRLLRKGYSFCYIPKALYHRRLRPFSMTHRHSERYPVWKSWMEELKEPPPF